MKEARDPKKETVKTVDHSAISVVGGGSWATALVKILTDNGHSLNWYLRRSGAVSHLLQYGHNPYHLSSVELPLSQIVPTSNLEEVLQASTIILAIPASFLSSTLSGCEHVYRANSTWAIAAKGLISEKGITPSHWLHQHLGIPLANLVHIAGPCHAEEIGAEKRSYLTLSSSNSEVASTLAKLLENRYLSTSLSDDLEGTQYASALKNIYALAAGISVGLGYGDNFRAVLLSAAMREMSEFLSVVCPAQRDLLLPVYLGDTLVTAYSQYSRNRTLGIMLGKGYGLQAALLELNQVAEGYGAAQGLHSLSEQFGSNQKVLHTVHNIMYMGEEPGDAFTNLAGRLA